MNCVIVYGNPFDGLGIVGPFDDFEEANRYADAVTDIDWWVVVIKKPLGDSVDSPHDDAEVERLTRERDEAVASHFSGLDALAKLAAERDEALRRSAWLYDDADRKARQLSEVEAERDEAREHLTRSGWIRMAERADAAEARVARLEEALTEDRLTRVFWKHTYDADLNTDEGCRAAAQVVAAYIAAIAAINEE